MKIELDTQGISAMAQPQLKLSDRGPELKQRYIPDFICYAKAILEPKSVSKLCDERRAQLHNYLNATRYRLGLLVNFGHQPKSRMGAHRTGYCSKAIVVPHRPPSSFRVFADPLPHCWEPISLSSARGRLFFPLPYPKNIHNRVVFAPFAGY